ncbi:MAG: FadR/GntR family transcriptional regulator, partial [bacterium]
KEEYIKWRKIKMLFESVKKKDEKIYERIVNQVTKKITIGELKPGDKLPSERELTELMNVSRSSLREAMKTLEMLGCVEIKHGNGIFISDKRQDKLIKMMRNLMFEDKESIHNLFDIRKTLETQAVSWAAERGTEEEILSLEKEINRIKDNYNEVSKKDIQEHNNKFHYLIFAMSHNPVLIKMMDVLNDFINEIYPKTIEIPKRIDKSLNDHKKLLEKIKNRESEAAKELMLEHLSTVEEAIEKYYKEK